MGATTPEELSALYAAAYGAKDADAVASLYEDDAVYAMAVADTIVEGRGAIRDAVRQMFDAVGTITFEDDEPVRHVVAGDWAFVHGTTRVTVTFEDGSRHNAVTRATTVLHRGPDGFWRLAIDHASA